MVPITSSLALALPLEKDRIDARKLHAFLEVKDHFRTWMSRLIEDYGFQEPRDFRAFSRESSGGRPSKEYRLSLSCAKEVCMVSRTPRGKEARLYFIACEEDLKNLAASPLRFMLDTPREWQKRFPDIYFTELGRLKGQNIRAGHGPSWVAGFTLKWVYASISPVLPSEMRARVPSPGYMQKLHQALNDDGLRALDLAIQRVLSFAAVARTYGELINLLRAASGEPVALSLFTYEPK